MSVLQFAFGDKPDNRYLPHNHAADTVVYTGTHDNDTTLGWYRGAPEHVRDHVRRYFARDGSDAAWDFLRAAWASVGQLAIAPLQDVMNLGSEARMNFPGKPAGNWGWRLTPGGIQPWMTERLAELTHLYGRAQLPQSP
jgi:4-alpha-glucanotransferase